MAGHVAKTVCKKSPVYDETQPWVLFYNVQVEEIKFYIYIFKDGKERGEGSREKGKR